MLAACTNAVSAGVKSVVGRADTVRARTKVLKANRPRGRDAKPRSSGRVSRAATRSVRPMGLRDRGPGESVHTGPTIPSGGFTHMLNKLRYARPGREGLHAHRAPGRHSDHRHPRRDRPARVPQPARQGAGHRGQVGRSARIRPRWRPTTPTSRPTPRCRPARCRPSSRRSSGGKAHADRVGTAGTATATSSSRRRRPATTFTITKDADGTVTRTCTRSGTKGRLPLQRQLVVHSQQLALRRGGPSGARLAAFKRAFSYVRPGRLKPRRPPDADLANVVNAAISSSARRTASPSSRCSSRPRPADRHPRHARADGRRQRHHVKTRAREGGTNLTRELVEAARSVPYDEPVAELVVSQLQSQPGLADAGIGAG